MIGLSRLVHKVIYGDENHHEKTGGKSRSTKWPAFRDAYLKGKVCIACGGKDKLQAHHIEPFHLNPEKELDENNLVPLCESKAYGINCHLFVGHLGNFRSFNVDVINDAKTWADKLKDRPITKEDSSEEDKNATN